MPRARKPRQPVFYGPPTLAEYQAQSQSAPRAPSRPRRKSLSRRLGVKRMKGPGKSVLIDLAKATAIDALGGGASVGYDVVVAQTTNKIDDNRFLKPVAKLAIGAAVRYFGGRGGDKFSSAWNGETIGQAFRRALKSASIKTDSE